MKKKLFTLTLIVLLVLAGAIWYGYKPRSQHLQSNQTATNAVTAIPTTPVTSGSNLSLVASHTDPSALETEERDIHTKYTQGLIDKRQAMQALALLANKKPQDLYGKVTDQYGNPVADASVDGELVLNNGTYGGIQVKKYNTMTDRNGLFEFTDVQGVGLGVRINKAGYKTVERGEEYKGAIGGLTSPADRTIYTMWKLHGAEPLVNSGINAKIPHDGNSTVFSIATGKTSADGDLRVTLLRSPLEVDRGKDVFDWTLKIEILHGGLIAENDGYDYWAPETGYQSSFEFNVRSNAVHWHSTFDGKFYIKTAQGKYGRMQFGISSALTPARIEASFTINPSGSQNLEPPVD